ncbi:MAG TPA: tetratricopeptide repeat protein [Rhizomicrobium sp.]|nr:tetratricopeptide repeat protein [Rhizomicrobium sp.]
MTQKLFALLILAFCACLAMTPSAQARSSAEIAADFATGVAAYDAGDYPKAFKIWWELRFEDLAAMRNLGMMLRKGIGTEKNAKRAEEIYLRAAEVGMPTAQADLADMYLKGELGAPDLSAALPLLARAAAANHPGAQFQLGEFYETGAPPLVPKDLEKARELYAAAAHSGMPEAIARSQFLGPPAMQAGITHEAPLSNAPPAPAAPVQSVNTPVQSPPNP